MYLNVAGYALNYLFMYIYINIYLDLDQLRPALMHWQRFWKSVLLYFCILFYLLKQAIVIGVESVSTEPW